MTLRSKRFTGLLNERGLIDDHDCAKKLLPLLFRHYKIRYDPNDRKNNRGPWLVLAMSLAGDYVPAFKPKKPTGRKYTAAQADIDLTIVHALGNSKNVLKDVETLVKNEPSLWGRSTEHVRQRFYRLIKPGTREHKNFTEFFPSLPILTGKMTENSALHALFA